MWINELYQSWTGRTQTNRRARRAKLRPSKRLSLEALEDRTLLSAPAPVTISSGMSANDVNQFGGGNPTSTSGKYFLGSNTIYAQKTGGFNVNVGVGSAGGNAFLTLSGPGGQHYGSAGLNLSYSASLGTVKANYGKFTLNQNYAEPTQFGQQVNFTPQNTKVSYTSGSFSTTSPQVSANANLDLGLNFDIGGNVNVTAASQSVFSTSGSTSFGINVNNQPLGAYSTVSGLSIFGHSIAEITGAGGKIDGLSLNGGLAAPSVSFSVEIVPPVSLEVTVGINSTATGLTESFALAAGLPLAGGGVSVSQPIGSATQTIPSIAVNSNSLRTVNGVPDGLQGTSTNDFATLDLNMNLLASALLSGAGPLGAASQILSTNSISAGPFSATLTGLDFTLDPSLSLVQTGTVTPTNELTYSFFNQSTGKSMMVDVTKNGTNLGKVSSVTFTPGVDTLGIDFTGTPIEVKPTWTYGMSFQNEVDLDATLGGTLTGGQANVTASGGGVSVSAQVGPAYSQNFTFAQTPIASLYNGEFPLVKSVSKTLTPFTIGSTFTPSLKVNTTVDNNAPYNTNVADSGSLRAAIDSANQNYAEGNTRLQVIKLGPGTYNLTIPRTGNDDNLSGDLNVDSNLEIVGSGIGQTIINASGLGDRIFSVAAGDNLTLVGVTLENGGGSTSIPGGQYVADGGGIYNAGSLKIRNSELTENSAEIGGGIFNLGTAKISNTKLFNDFAQDAGGGIFNSGSLTVSNSTLSDNVATTTTVSGIGGGGIYNVGAAAISASTFYDNSVTNGTGGGGIYNSGKLTLSDSTLYGNISFQAGGALYESSKGSASLINDTLTRNRANYLGIYPNGQVYTLGGGIYVAGGGSSPPRLANTIVAQNYNGTSTSTLADDIVGSLDTVSSLNNLIGTGGSGGLVNGSNGNQVGIANPGLGTLGNYGGPTQTVPLLRGSPAINAGNNAEFDSATDQRGYGRVVGDGITAVDIGAYEYGAVPADTDLALTGSISSTSVIPGGQITYALTLTNKGSKSQSDITLFDAPPADATIVSWTAPTGWQSGIGLPYGYNSDTFFAWSNSNALAPGASVTFTLVLQVNGGTAPDTVLKNTASIGPIAGDPQHNNNTVTLQAAVHPVNVTDQLSITPQFPLFVDQQNGEYFTTVNVTDNKGNLNGPLGLVITGLPEGVTLINATGTFGGNPYYEFVPIGSSLIDHNSVNFVVLFKVTGTGAPFTSFGTQVWQGL